MSEEMKLVPIVLLNAMAATFECYAQCGMLHKYDDGTKTPNAINCESYAKQLNEIIAAAPAHADEPVELPPISSAADEARRYIHLDLEYYISRLEQRLRAARPSAGIRSEVIEVLRHLRSLCSFAYEQGYHEIGYDPVTTIAEMLAKPVGNISDETLRNHWLHQIECDHERKKDRPICACSRVDLGWHPSIFAAVNAWIDHLHTQPIRALGESS